MSAWRDDRNAVGFASECARVALSLSGNSAPLLVKAIEFLDSFLGADLPEYDWDHHHEVACDLSCAAGKIISGTTGAASAAASAVSEAIEATLLSYGDDSDDRFQNTVNQSVWCSSDAGVDDSDIAVAYARWVVRDISPRWPIDEQLRQAAGAAIVAGDEALAREILR